MEFPAHEERRRQTAWLFWDIRQGTFLWAQSSPDVERKLAAHVVINLPRSHSKHTVEPQFTFSSTQSQSCFLHSSSASLEVRHGGQQHLWCQPQVGENCRISSATAAGWVRVRHSSKIPLALAASYWALLHHAWKERRMSPPTGQLPQPQWCEKYLASWHTGLTTDTHTIPISPWRSEYS